MGSPVGPWFPHTPGAKTICPTWCWLGDSELVDALQTCIDACADELAGYSSKPLYALERAATVVFEGIDDILRPFLNTELSPHWRHDIVRAERFAKDVLLGRMTVPEMKRLQRTASREQPLTVCDGKRRRQVTILNADGTAGRVVIDASHGDGCGIVHRDSHRSAYKLYCERCSATDSNRRRKADARGRAHASGLRRVGERGAALWAGTCKVCGGEFVTSRPDARRCDKCRRHGRRLYETGNEERG